jgi:hypothetical protein
LLEGKFVDLVIFDILGLLRRRSWNDLLGFLLVASPEGGSKGLLKMVFLLKMVSNSNIGTLRMS